MPYYNKDLSYPVPPAPSWEIQDASKVKTAMECWRKYFFEYVLGWRPASANIHLIFGSAWHEALAMLYLSDFSVESVQKAYYKGFLPYYRAHFDESDDEIYSPKIPSRAFVALAAYANRHKDEERDYKILSHNGVPMVEIGGTINLSEDRVVTFKMDTIMEGPHGIISREHKTGSSTWNWNLQWYLSPQVGTYSHVLYCLYEERDVRGVIVDGTFFKKTKDDAKKDLKDPFRHFDFMEVPVYKSPSNMNAWLNTMLWWLDMIEWNFNLLAECSAKDNIMKAFPMNPTGCTNWSGCPYHDLCMAWANPLKHVERPPIGFQIEHWNPLAEEPRVMLNKL